ncbi:unnamed protein product [Lactuca saligna]|uniref:Sister chromatid cohesion 1 protein 3 n=1 Tax=Lactuca saligna TaxID=75948 RepID=A0AA35URR2_LACSI|nr:unnamed protein product [Lactuca saligna]
MFYSHNLLARKGPLGTVWCAAHLQNKLKKSNYITVNIPSTVEQIMNPQVPIALRMSGHLLLGVVRIYSKKVEYLQHDCNVLRIDISKVYANADINLPEDANQAKFDSITLPDRFDLDLMDIDDYDPFGSPDTHLRGHEDITLSENRDQIPSGYIVISFGEDASSNPSLSGNDSQSRGMPVVESAIPETPPVRITTTGFQDPGPSHQGQSSERFSNENENDRASPEVIRDAIHNNDYFHMSPPSHLSLPDRVEPDPELVNEIEISNQSALPTLTPTMDETDGLFVPPHQTPPRDSTSTHSEPVNHNFDPPVLYEVAPSPSVEPEPALVANQPRAKRRKIKYDEAIVLTNEFMEKSLKDHSNLLRKRKGVACSSLDVGRVNNIRKKEKVLFEPVFTGLSDKLCKLFDGAHMSSRAHQIRIEEEAEMEIEHQHHQPENVGSRAHQIHIEEENDMEIEHQRENVGPGPSAVNVIPTYSPDHNNYTSFSSPPPTDEYTPAMTDVGGSRSYPVQTTIGSTPDPTSSTGSFLSDVETPATFFQDHHGFDNTGALSDIPEIDDAGELAFIEEDGGSPMSLRGTPQSDYSSARQRSPPEIGSLQARTRAVAQYIKEKSSATPSSSSTLQNAGSVSLNTILEGKRRKVCARMFYETLVLKSCDLVEVKQDEPYGDIILKVTSKLAKHQFSN